MQLISEVTVGSGGAASITFMAVGDIPSEYTDLLVVISARTDRAAVGASVIVGFNGLTTGFSNRTLYGGGSEVLSFVDARLIGSATGTSATANTFSNTALYIPNYLSNQNKSFSSDSVFENNATSADALIVAGLWSNTAAITSIEISSGNAPNFVEHTTASLYGITAGSDGIVSVS